MKKPLSEITEEDAAGVAKILWPYNPEYWQDVDFFKLCIKKGAYLDFIQVYNFLESKGYEVPPNPYKGEPQQEQTAEGLNEWQHFCKVCEGLIFPLGNALTLSQLYEQFKNEGYVLAYKQQQETGIEQAIKALEWISVKDMLPENHNLVNVILQSGAITCGRLLNDFSHWSCLTTEGSRIVDVTHWMPLPNPPKANQ